MADSRRGAQVEAPLNELGTKAGAWLDGGKADSVGEFEVSGAKVKVMVGMDAKDRPMRVLSIDGAKGHSCNGSVKDGGSRKSPEPSYSVSC